jgi:large subunit ribosomal protein L25
MQLQAETRQKFGKATKGLRKEGLIPAELYGHGVENMHLSVKETDFRKVFKQAGANTVIELVVGNEKRNAIVHGVQRNSVLGTVDHVDFYQVRMDEEIEAKIPFEFVGEAPAVKEQGGILTKAMNEITVSALPAHLPHSIKVDLVGLTEIGRSIYVKDLEIPKGVTVTLDPETVIASISAQQEEEVVAAPVDVTAVKVETEEKKAEREKENSDSEAK